MDHLHRSGAVGDLRDHPVQGCGARRQCPGDGTVHLDRFRQSGSDLGAAGRPADLGHDDRRDRRVGHGAHLFLRLHAPRQVDPPVHELPQPVHLLHADAHHLGQPGAAVLRLGRGRARVLPADRLLVRPAVGQRRRHQGFRGQPGRRFRLRTRHLRHLHAVRHGQSGHHLRGRARQGRRHVERVRRRIPCADRMLPAAVRGRHGQIGAVGPAYLVARRPCRR